MKQAGCMLIRSNVNEKDWWLVLSRSDERIMIEQYLQYNNQTQRKMSDNITTTEQISPNEDNPAKILKIAIGYATFENRDLGGKVFSLLDSLSDDLVHAGVDLSEVTEELMPELIALIQSENEELQGRLLEDEDEDEDEEDDIPVKLVDDEEDDDNDKDEDEDDDGVPVKLEDDLSDEKDLDADEEDNILPRDEDDEDDEEDVEELLNQAKRNANTGDSTE